MAQNNIWNHLTLTFAKLNCLKKTKLNIELCVIKWLILVMHSNTWNYLTLLTYVYKYVYISDINELAEFGFK